MKRVVSSQKLTVHIAKTFIIQKKYAPKKVVASVINALDVRGDGLRSKFYNSFSWGKYNTTVIGGIDCIDVTRPMKKERASLVIDFVIDEGTKNA